jgi:hypothetical protein
MEIDGPRITRRTDVSHESERICCTETKPIHKVECHRSSIGPDHIMWIRKTAWFISDANNVFYFLLYYFTKIFNLITSFLQCVLSNPGALIRLPFKRMRIVYTQVVALRVNDATLHIEDWKLKIWRKGALRLCETERKSIVAVSTLLKSSTKICVRSPFVLLPYGEQFMQRITTLQHAKCECNSGLKLSF